MTENTSEPRTVQKRYDFINFHILEEMLRSDEPIPEPFDEHYEVYAELDGDDLVLEVTEK